MYSRGPSIFGIGPPTPSSGLTPSSRPSRGASSIPRLDETMQVHEYEEWQYEMPHIKVF